MGTTVHLQPQPGPQTEFLKTTADICLYGGAAGGGKVAPLDSIVKTPFGDKKMGDVKVGSSLINPNGNHQKVIATHPHKEWDFYRITFNDESSTECGLEHLWVSWQARVITKKARTLRKNGHVEDPFSLFPESAKVRDTAELKKLVDGGNHMLIPVTKPIHFTMPSKEKDKLDPYFLGLMLGDGCISGTASPSIISEDEDIVAYVESLYDCTRIKGSVHPLVTIPFSRNRLLKKKLEDYKLLGTRSHTKFIPKPYLTAPLEDRIALLQGLMDTDGYVDERGHYEYCTVSDALCADVKELVETLGGWATVTRKQGQYREGGGRVVECKMANYLYIKLPNEVVPFRLQRKIDRIVPNKGRLYRTIKSIEYSRTCDGQCITVDNPNSLYLTDSCIVTHNSYALLLEPLRHLPNSKFSAVIFRRNSKQITNPGGLWDEASELYPSLGANPTSFNLQFTFPSGMRVRFAHLEHEKNKNDWQGSQIPLIGFDELEHFTEGQFFYMLSRNRSGSGVPGYIRATTNPAPKSWIRNLIDWYIGDDGFPIKSRSGVVRYFIRQDGEILWADSIEDMEKQYGKKKAELAKSFTFISATLKDNQILLEKDPNYLSNLEGLPRIEREKLLAGNWDVEVDGGNYFNRSWCEVLSAVPTNVRIVQTVRYWDRAATKPCEGYPDPDWTVGVKASLGDDGRVYISDVIRIRDNPHGVINTILKTRQNDGQSVRQLIEKDPGAAGKTEATLLRRKIALGGYDCRIRAVTANKLTRFTGFSAAAEAGDIVIIRGPWNEAYFSELERFNGDGKSKDDQVDGSSGAYTELIDKVMVGNISLTLNHALTKTNVFGG